MEVILGGALFKSKSSNSAIPSTTTKSKRNLSASEVGPKMESNKKRGVYVEKWVNPKLHAEDNKRQHKAKTQTILRRDTHKLLTSAPAESKISTFTRLLGTTDPTVRIIKRKPHKSTFPEKLLKQTSKISNQSTSKQSKFDKPRNIVEENKNVKYTKLRSNTLKEIHAKDTEKVNTFKTKKEIIQTPSTSSKITRDSSYDTHWSAIFPNQENSKGNANLLQQYICNYEQTVSKPAKEKDDTPATTDGKGKDEPIYNFFIDLLESVYDEDVTDNPDAHSSKSSVVKFEIDDHVADKLLSQEDDTNHYTIRDEDYEYDQSRELAEYYNRSRLIPQKTARRRKKMNKCYACVHKSAYDPKEKAEKKVNKKLNLLNLLKQQLSLGYTTQEPESMYEALLNIAKNKHRRRQIYFETTEPSDIEGVCRFKRRNVISPSTRLPKKKPANFGSINTTRGKNKNGSVTSIRSHIESIHSLEVLGFDYDEMDIMESDMGYSDIETAVSKVRHITNLNEGITTVTQNWKNRYLSLD